jgi:two-component system sensor histidine kinase KdpD
MSGTLDAEDTPGGGLTMVLTLRAVHRGGSPASAAAEGPVGEGAGLAGRGMDGRAVVAGEADQAPAGADTGGRAVVPGEIPAGAGAGAGADGPATATVDRAAGATAGPAASAAAGTAATAETEGVVMATAERQAPCGA